MALTAVDKMKINKFIKEHAEGEIYYLELCDALSKKTKVKDVEFLDYFVNCVVNELRKEEKISMKHLKKLLSIVNAFLGWVSEEGSYVIEDTVEKMRNFGNYYEEYTERMNIEKEEEIINEYIKPITDFINKIIPAKEDDGLSTRYLNRIDELEKKVAELERKLENSERINNKLESDYDKQTDRLDALKGEKCNLEKEVRTGQKEIKTLNAAIGTLKEQLIALESEIESKRKAQEDLEGYKEKYEEIFNQLEDVTKTLNQKIEQEKTLALAEERKGILQSLIYQKILLTNIGINDLIRYLKKQGYETSREEISGILRDMSKVLNMQKNFYVSEPTYKIVEPKVNEDGTFDVCIPKGSQHYDILLVSDYHIKELDEKFLSSYDKQMEYCVKNNISLVLNLGDFFHALGNKVLSYDSAVKNIELTQAVIATLPKENGIYHGLLGGNHDRLLLKYGIDPIKTIANERDDFINLGYTHSTIALNSTNAFIGSFDIHHPESYEFAIDLDHAGIDMEGMNNYLNRIYERQGRNRQDSYVDIIGHTHKSQYNCVDNYCFIPSFCEGGPKKGACHLRIYFDEENQIKYMVFMPLNVSTQLIRNNEIVYKKVLSKE